jgi:hypothetical protein
MGIFVTRNGHSTQFILNSFMKKYYVLGLIVALSTVLAVPRVHAAGSSQVVFSEIAWGGSQKSTADEWIELANLGNGSIDISGWTMTGLATSGGVLTIPANTSIAAGGTYLVANYKMGSSSTLLIPPNLVTTAVSIPNTALNFALFDTAGTMVDSLVDPGAPNAGSNTTFATMERNSDLSWVTAEVSTNLDGGQFGSPGVIGHKTAPVVVTVPVATVEPVASAPIVIVSAPSESASPVPSMNGGVDASELTAPIVSAPAVTVEAIVAPVNEVAVAPVEVVAVPTIPLPAQETPVVTATQEVSASTIVIASLLPSPNTGEDEALTLTNVGNVAVTIDGYTLVDASGKVTTLTGLIEPNADFVVTNPAGKLNNDGDSITLFDASGTQIDAITYGTDEIPAPKKNETLQLVDGVWSSVTTAIVTEVPPVVSETVPMVASEQVVADPVVVLDQSGPLLVPEVETVPVPEQAAPVASETSAPKITITSLLPSPNTGEDETLTLTNMGSTAATIDGYTITDASGKVTALTGSIEPGANFVVANPAGKLNNDGDSITLFDAAGLPIDSVTYGTDEIPAPKKNVELQLVNGVWSTAASEAPSNSPMNGGGDATEPDIAAVIDVVTAPVVVEVTPDVSGQGEQNAVVPVANEVTVNEVTATTPTVTLADTVIDPIVTATSNESSTPVVASAASVDLIITSLLPAPSTGGDEWVELTNRSEMSVDLSSYSLVDASGATTTLSGTIEAGASTMILNPKGKLNNDSDSVTLYDGAGNTVDSVTYGGDASSTPKKDEVVTFATLSPTLYAESDSTNAPSESTTVTADAAVATASQHSEQTSASTVAAATSSAATAHSTQTATSVVKTPVVKGEAKAVKTVKTVKASTSSTKTTKKTAAARSVSIGDIASIADDTLVTLEGTVVAVPGIIGKRSFFLDGLEVYQSQDDLAAVSVGDHVRITGTVSVLSDHRRVNIKADGVTMLGSSTPIVHDYAAGLSYGSLVRVTGTVSARDGNAVVLATDDENVTVTLGNGVTMKWADLAGKKVTIVGVLKSSNDSATVVLRSAEDVTVVAEAVDQTSTVAGTSTAQNFPWTMVGLAAASLAGLGAWFWRMKPRSSLTNLTLKPTAV